jgi:hypothetical protein
MSNPGLQGFRERGAWERAKIISWLAAAAARAAPRPQDQARCVGWRLFIFLLFLVLAVGRPAPRPTGSEKGGLELRPAPRPTRVMMRGGACGVVSSTVGPRVTLAKSGALLVL